MSEFLEVIPNELPGIPHEREIDYGIDLLRETNPISIPPYGMDLTELKEFRVKLKDLLDKVFIWPSTSSWGSTDLFLKKKMGP